MKSCPNSEWLRAFIQLKPGEKSVLRFLSRFNRVFGRANIARCADRHSIGDHEVDELGHARSFGSRSVVFGNDHLGEVLDHPVVLRRKKQWLVRVGSGLGGCRLA